MKANDQKWGELNSRLIESMKIGDWKTMSLMYLEEAKILLAEKKNIHSVMREAQKCELIFEKSLGISEVEISISVIRGKGCIESRNIQGHKMAIDEAIKLMPVPIKCDNPECSCICGYAVQIRKSPPYSVKTWEYPSKDFSTPEKMGWHYVNIKKLLACGLLNYFQMGVKEVEILDAGASSCPICQSLRGKVFTIQKAFAEMPIPVKDCDNAYGYCRCTYLSKI